MDNHRFDSLTKTLAKGFTRRKAFSRLAGGGVAAATLAAVGAGRSSAFAQDAGGGEICAVNVEASVTQGPSAGEEYIGLLVLQVGEGGRIDNGALLAADNTASSVVGQINGRAVSLLFTVGDGQSLYGVGVMERDIEEGCAAPTEGKLDGPFVGPQATDGGDWAACCCPSADNNSNAPRTCRRAAAATCRLLQVVETTTTTAPPAAATSTSAPSAVFRARRRTFAPSPSGRTQETAPGDHRRALSIFTIDACPIPGRVGASRRRRDALTPITREEPHALDRPSGRRAPLRRRLARSRRRPG